MANTYADTTAPAASVSRRTSGGDAPLDACPRCASNSFHAEATVDRPTFRCEHCGMGWLYELGYVRAAATAARSLWRVAEAPQSTSPDERPRR